MQKNGVHKYSPEQIRKEIAMNYNSVDQKKWYSHYNNSETAMNWLIDIMAEGGYDCALEAGSVIAPDDLYYTAPSAHGFINKDNKSVGMTQPFVVNTLAKKLEALGGKIYYKHIGRQLVRGGAANGTSGRVTALIAEREDGAFIRFEGARAVVLATGDFSADRDMMTKYCPWAAKYVSDELYNSPVDYDKEFAMGGLYKGDGHKMGLWAGAAWQKTYPNATMGGTITVGPSPIIYDPFFGLLVDRDGERFMNEYASSQLSGRTQWLQAGEKSYAIWDRDFVKASDTWFPAQGGIGIMQPMTTDEVIARWDAMVETGMYKRYNTLAELVDALGLPREKTLQTISRYNDLCDQKNDVDFYKRADKLIPIRTPPFYGAVSGGVGLLTILGGLRTNARMQVCDGNDNPIPGLYNVGTMVGDFYAGLYTFQMEGLNYGATCVTFGYLTGKYIASSE
jgi:succinate dehydrogenase/fumarate reductase flavoprotein subunit